MRHLRAGQAGGTQEPEAPLKRLLAPAGLLLTACSLLPISMRPEPPMIEQKAHIQRNELLGQILVPAAFVQTWGEPSYVRGETTQFFPDGNGNAVPLFLLPIGQAPPGWDSTVRWGDGYFMNYADRGELLGFLDGRLVYREKLPSDRLHAIGREWKQDDIRRTGLEKNLTVPQ